MSETPTPPGPAPRRFSLRHPGGETPILVGERALVHARAELIRWLEGRTAFLISTPRVLHLHGHRLTPLTTAARRWVVLEVEEGEAAKTPARAEQLWNEMLAGGGKRDSRVLAFGGGSVGDLGGFVAGCFLRGIEVVQLPSTLLAQADAAIGGKTAVDLPGAKNSVGLFHHPAFVVCDTTVLSTLPREEVRSGLMEVIKKAALLDAPLFARIERELPALLAGDPERLGPVVAAAAEAKARLVEADPDEQGDRRLLNFGHTLGHALESAAAYSGLRHGEAVGYGMLFALRLAVKRGLAPEVASRIAVLIGRADLPSLASNGPAGGFDAADLAARMARDKKAQEGGLTWVLPASLGSGRCVEGIGWEEVVAELRSFLREPLALPLAV